jgi:hypothetical protein
MVDKIVPIETTEAPYYDDYDENKDFHRILFRPGFAVQARELTQLQTILQKQIERFGKHIFKNGSVVLGGEITYQGADENIICLNLKSQYQASDIVANNFFQKYIAAEIANTRFSEVTRPTAYVLKTAEQTTADPPVLIIKPMSSGSFSANIVVQTTTANVTNTFAQVNSSAGDIVSSSVVSINEGVYFFDGYFIKVQSQTIILDKFTNNSTYRVGLEIDDSIVDYGSDTSLLDPALEATNYQAPGASRYKITARLAKRSLASTDDTRFIELLRIENGEITKKVNFPIYSEIEKTLARRTFDESGNYTVTPFLIELQEHQPTSIPGTATLTAGTSTVTGNGTSFLVDVSVNSRLFSNNQTDIVTAIASNTSLSLANNFVFSLAEDQVLISNPDKFTVKLSGGKAYVKGYEFENRVTKLSVRRGRDYSNVSNYDLISTLGNYVYVNGVKGLPTIDQFEIYDIHRVGANSIFGGVNVANSLDATYTNTKIGTARIRAFEFVSASNNSNSLTHIYKAYLTDINITSSSYNTADAQSLVYIANTTSAMPGIVYQSNAAFNKIMQIDLSSKSNNNYFGNTFVSDTDFNSLIFPYPQQFIKPSSITDVDYQYREKSSTVTFTSGGTTSVATITLSSPESFVGAGTLGDSAKLSNFTVVLKNKSSAGSDALPDTFGYYSNGDILTFNTSQGRSISIDGTGRVATLTWANANTFQAEVIYSVGLTGTAPSERVKSRYNANVSLIQTGTANATLLSTNTKVYFADGSVQVQVYDSNSVIKTVGTPQSLYVSDVVSIRKIYDFGRDAGGNYRTITQANLSFATDLTSSYELDTGQNDNLYDHATITLKAGGRVPVGRLVAFFDYYSHAGTSGYLTVDSYPNATTNDGYVSIPTYTSPTTGKTYRLADSVDWRPIRTNGIDKANTGSISGALILQPDQSFSSDYSYYLGRTDKIILSSDRVFKTIEGVPADVPETPEHREGDMLLYTLNIPPFTSQPSLVDVRYNENKRYTMRDIGRLEKRIQNLEYYASLNLLEVDADSTTIVDSNGLTRFKNGIIVDSFNGHKVGDVRSYDYACSMDFQKGELRPRFSTYNSRLEVATGNTNIKYSIDTATLSYTLEEYAVQDVATNSVNINPFNYASFIGTMKLTPDNDVWKDTENRPSVLVNLEGENDAFESATLHSGTKYGDWQTDWSGVTSTKVDKGSSQFTQGYLTWQQDVSRSIDTVTTKQSRSITTTTIVPETITKQIGDNIVDVSVVPYMRSTQIDVKASQLKAGSMVFPFFDDQRMLAYWRYPTIIWIKNPTGRFDSTGLEKLQISNKDIGKVALQTIQANGAPLVLTIFAGHAPINIGDTITGMSSGNSAVVANVFVYSANVSSANTSNSYVVNLSTKVGLEAPNTPPPYDLTFGANNIFNLSDSQNNIIMIVTGTGSGQVRQIASYDSNNRIVTVDKPFVPAPDTTSVYSIGLPTVHPYLGQIAGSFVIPPATFFTGEKKFRLTSSFTNSLQDKPTFAEATFFAQGLVQTKEAQSISVRVPKPVVTTSIEQITTTSDIITSVETQQTLVRDDTPPPSSPSEWYWQGGGGGGGPDPGCGDTGGSGCGCGGKIVCTMMNRLYGFSPISRNNRLWMRWNEVNKIDPSWEKAYHKLFLPFVKRMPTNRVIRYLLEDFANTRTQWIDAKLNNKKIPIKRYFWHALVRPAIVVTAFAIRQGWIKPVDRSEIDRLSKVALNKILKDR